MRRFGASKCFGFWDVEFFESRGASEDEKPEIRIHLNRLGLEKRVMGTKCGPKRPLKWVRRVQRWIERN